MRTKDKIVQEFGNEALLRLGDDLEVLCNAATGNESVSVLLVGLRDELQIMQTVHSVTQTVLVSEKALPVFVKKLQPVLRSFGYTVTKEKSE